MGKISTGWQITKQSLHVIKHDKEIVLFPILSFIITLGLGALFFFLFLLPSLFAPELYEGSSIFNVTFFTLSFVFLIVVYFVNIYFEAAIISSAMIRFSGKNPTFGEGLAGPSKRVHALFIWAIINAVIAVILNILQNLGRRGGRGTQIGVDMARSLFGMAWNLLTFFVIPLIVLEKESPFASISRSKDLFKKTWGEYYCPIERRRNNIYFRYSCYCANYSWSTSGGSDCQYWDKHWNIMARYINGLSNKR